MPHIFISFILFFLISISFKSLLLGVGNKNSKKLEKQLEEERLANFSRKREIDADAFCLPNLDVLPIKEYPEDDDTFKSVINAQKKVLKYCKLKMVRLIPPLSNIEIKKRFGYGNLELVVNYEENYQAYIHALNNFAKSLVEVEDFTSAETVLMHCITEMQSNVLNSYLLLCEVYKVNNEIDKLKDMRSLINNIPVLQYDEDLKHKIEVHLNNLLVT